MSDLRERLRETPLPGEVSARERGWQLVAVAYAERDPAPRRRRRPARVIAAVAVAACTAAAVVFALTPPGEAVGDWLSNVVRPSHPRHAGRPALGALPGHGRLLVVSRTGPWIVQPDGTRRRLGAYEDAAFSPRGLYAVVTRGHMLAAVDPRGGLRWSLTRHARVTRPAWSPDGFRVAYRSGPLLRVVYGDGARDRPIARSAGVTPAWQAAAGHRLAYVDSAGFVAVRDTDTGRLAWRTPAGGRVTQLAWSPDGSRLLVVTPAAVRVLRADGRVVRVVRSPRLWQAVRAAWLPAGHRFALVRTSTTVPAFDPEAALSRASTGSEVELVSAARAQGAPAARRLLALRGRLTGVLASPDGEWLLVTSASADQWLLVRTTATGRITTLSNVARQFDPGARRPGPLPQPVGWIR